MPERALLFTNDRSDFETILENKQCTLSYSHTIATTSRRPLTTTFFVGAWGRLSSFVDDNLRQPPKKSGCQRSATGCRYSVDCGFRRSVVSKIIHLCMPYCL